MLKCDVVVIGCGGVGSAALYSLASRGLSVVGIDKFSPPHKFGSSHGHTRAIRKAYFEHPNYVPLLQSSYELWRELERKSRKSLLELVGALEVGTPDGILINGIKQSAKEHDLPVEFLSTGDALDLFPGMFFPEDYEIAYEKDAGYLLVEQCIDSFISLAVSNGAKLLTETHVIDWSVSGGVLRVNTSRGLVEAGSLVIAGGPWAASLLGEIEGVVLELKKKHMYWYSNDNPEYYASSGLPVFAFEVPKPDGDRVYYGFPQIDSTGVKIAEHTGGQLVNSPTEIKDSHDPDAEQTDHFQRTFLPHVTGGVSKHEACLYTVSHDENFYLDIHPQYNNVAYVAGLSGHGFKFAPVLGEVLADFVIHGTSDYNIDFLRPVRNRKI